MTTDGAPRIDRVTLELELRGPCVACGRPMRRTKTVTSRTVTGANAQANAWEEDVVLVHQACRRDAALSTLSTDARTVGPMTDTESTDTTQVSVETPAKDEQTVEVSTSAETVDASSEAADPAESDAAEAEGDSAE